MRCATGLDCSLDVIAFRLEDIALSRSDEQKIRGGITELGRECSVRAHDRRNVLMRIEAAEVNEPARASGQSGPVGSCRDVALARRRTVLRLRGLEGDA